MPQNESGSGPAKKEALFEIAPPFVGVGHRTSSHLVKILGTALAACLVAESADRRRFGGVIIDDAEQLRHLPDSLKFLSKIRNIARAHLPPFAMMTPDWR